MPKRYRVTSLRRDTGERFSTGHSTLGSAMRMARTEKRLGHSPVIFGSAKSPVKRRKRR